MSLTSISLGLRELLRDPIRRQEFFKAITQDEIASQIRSLRKKRKLNQTEFARLSDMKQSAVSRIEQAGYSSWTLTTLFRVADALDARWRVILEPAEQAIEEYEALDSQSRSAISREAGSGASAVSTGTDQIRLTRDPVPTGATAEAHLPMTPTKEKMAYA
jgi:transcriptional regulator with XRE-family HTH domain